MLALKSAESTNRYNSLLQEASASNSSRSILYDFIHQPELFVVDLETPKHSRDESDNILFKSNNAFGINLDEIVGSEWHEEKVKEQTEESTNAFGIDLNEILGSEFQEEKSVEEPHDLEIKTTESIADAIKVENNSREIVDKIIFNESSEHEEQEVNEEESTKRNEDENSDQDEVKHIVDEEEKLPIAESEKREESDIESSNEQIETFLEDKIVSEEVVKEPTGDLEFKAKAVEIIDESEKKSVAQEHIEAEETVDNEITPDLETKEESLDAAESSIESESSEEVEVPILQKVEEEILEKNQTESETKIEESIDQVEEYKVEVVDEPMEELVFESPVHSDFLTFVDKEEPKNIEEQKEEVTAYNDDSMPYTFLWWLNKTRKEYAESHQPYVKSKSPSIKLDIQQEIKKQEKDDLNHQIAENIFHLRGVEEFTGNSSRTPTVPFEFMRKDFQIIEKFIKEEPQIRPPAPNKIDTENKAKKSSEDSNEVVSETLAKIYVEQMLYHKALDVYKKLSLKFPEKSAYFASQIKYLELKVN